MLSIPKHDEKRKLEGGKPLNHETNYHLSCCVIDQKKKELFF